MKQFECYWCNIKWSSIIANRTLIVRPINFVDAYTVLRGIKRDDNADGCLYRLLSKLSDEHLFKVRYNYYPRGITIYFGGVM